MCKKTYIECSALMCRVNSYKTEKFDYYNAPPSRMSMVAGRTSRSFRYTLLDGGELADGVDHHVVHARGEAGVGEAATPAVAGTVWKRCAVWGRRPAPWMIWHSRLPLASIASIGACGFWSLGLGLE